MLTDEQIEICHKCGARVETATVTVKDEQISYKGCSECNWDDGSRQLAQIKGGANGER